MFFWIRFFSDSGEVSREGGDAYYAVEKIIKNGLCKEDYCLLDCQNHLYASDSQKFFTKRIYTAADVAKKMNIPLNHVNSKNIYPFNIFTSVVNNNCLTINDGGITLEKCNLNNIKQQWEISPDENICYLK